MQKIKAYIASWFRKKEANPIEKRPSSSVQREICFLPICHMS